MRQSLDGMILAAGLGTRLRPLTDRVPKALIDVGGLTLLDRTLRRLVAAGCDRIVVNVHHHADLVVSFLEEGLGTAGRGPGSRTGPGPFGAEIRISRETGRPLETGGGLKAAATHFRGDRPILVHNVDVLSAVDLDALIGAHVASGGLATLAVQRRHTQRPLVFDDGGLCGRLDRRTGIEEWARRPGLATDHVGFTGIHVVRPDLPGRLALPGAFSIIRSYLHFAAAGETILAYDATGQAWTDVGTPERLERARAAASGLP